MRMHKNSIKEKKRLDRYPVMMWVGFAYSKIGKTKEENIYIIFKCVKYAIKRVVINCSHSPTDGKM